MRFIAKCRNLVSQQDRKQNIFFGIKFNISLIENSINFIILSEILPKFMLHLTKKLYISIGLFLSIGLFYACNKQIPENQNSNKTSFEIIQDNILTPSCALSGCHLSSADATFSQHGLVLSKGNSFANLVGKSPKNAAAKADKLLLVFPGDATYSFLYHKIACDSLHNHGNSSLYGSHMPMGGGYISKGQVEFIRRWINAGASLTDRTVDQSILKDSSACQIAFKPLAAPPPSLGFQLKTDLFSLKNTNSALKTENADLKSKNSEISTELTELKDSNTKLKRKYDELDQSYDGLLDNIRKKQK